MPIISTRHQHFLEGDEERAPPTSFKSTRIFFHLYLLSQMSYQFFTRTF